MARAMLVLLVLLAATAGARAAPEVYVNNRPFPGKVAGSGVDVLLEAEPLFRLLGLDYEVDGETVVVHGLPLAASVRDGVAMVSARGVAEATGGRVVANPDLGTVDLYAHDVAAAARAAWERVFVQPEVQTAFDLQVLAWTTRQLLRDDLGMKLDQPVSLRLEDGAGMARAGLGDKALGGAVYGADRVTFLLRQGSSPLSVISTMAFNWGVTWARSRGLRGQDAQAQALGLWASYNVLRRLGLDPPRQTYGEWQGEGAHTLFLNLCAIQDERGPAAVLDSIRSPGSRTKEN